MIVFILIGLHSALYSLRYRWVSDTRHQTDDL